jgi:hypothetical protein
VCSVAFMCYRSSRTASLAGIIRESPLGGGAAGSGSGSGSSASRGTYVRAPTSETTLDAEGEWDAMDPPPTAIPVHTHARGSGYENSIPGSGPLPPRNAPGYWGPAGGDGGKDGSRLSSGSGEQGVRAVQLSAMGRNAVPPGTSTDI